MFDFYKNKRILITGHTGFKGGWLSIWLERLGAQVAGYSLEPLTEPNLFEMAGVENRVESEINDIRDYESVLGIFKRFEPEIVFHLAAQPLVRRSYKSPKETFDVNFSGTVNVLEAIRQTSSVKSVVLITTDKVYENREWIWGYRENDPMGGFDPYSASKGAVEIAISAYIRSFFDEVNRPDIGVASARAGNVIGGGDFSEDRIIPDAVRALQNGDVLPVRSPRSIRPWQHVLEPLAAYLLLGKKLYEKPQKFAGAWNFGPAHHDVATVEQVVNRFYFAYGKGNWKDVSSGQKNAVHEAGLLWLCCDKAKALLDWTPALDTDQATELTAKWYQDVLENGEDAWNVCVRDIDRFGEELKNKQLRWASEQQ